MTFPKPSQPKVSVFKILQWLSTAQTRKQHIQPCKLTLLSSPTLLPSTQSSCFNFSRFPKDNGLLPPPSPDVLLLLSYILSATHKLICILWPKGPLPGKECSLYSLTDVVELDCQDSNPDYSLMCPLYGLSFHPCQIGKSLGCSKD